MTQKEKVNRLIDAFGSQSGLARAIGVTPQAVQKWARRGVVPAPRVKDVVVLARGFGIDVKPEDLNSEVFG